ncbi:MAG: HAD family hydrolase [Ignavibacterium sp.]|nr:HAD family hydrolase [Ignavibacterium sp.]MBS4034212.1 HAD family hydrolase [Ignavibacterium sp.]
MINGTIKHIIWDWNGTLLNDVILCRDVMNNLLKRFNLPVLTTERYREIFTFPVSDYYIKAGIDFKTESFEVLGRIFMELYEQRKYECDLYDGVMKGLDFFSNNNVTHSILSAYHHKTLTEIIDHFNIKNYFEKVAGLDNIYAGGKLGIGEKLIQDLPYKKEETVLIGDTIHDKEVADALGINVIIIADGHQDEARLKQLNVPVYSNFKTFLLSNKK